MGNSFCGIFPSDAICIPSEPAKAPLIKPIILSHYNEHSVSKRIEIRRRNSADIVLEKGDLDKKFRNFSVSATVKMDWNTKKL